MLITPTIDKLHALALTGMARAPPTSSRAPTKPTWA